MAGLSIRLAAPAGTMFGPGRIDPRAFRIRAQVAVRLAFPGADVSMAYGTRPLRRDQVAEISGADESFPVLQEVKRILYCVMVEMEEETEMATTDAQESAPDTADQPDPHRDPQPQLAATVYVHMREHPAAAPEEAPALAEQLRQSTERIAKLATRWHRLYYGAEDGDDVYYAERTMEQLEAERKRYNELLAQIPPASVSALCPHCNEPVEGGGGEHEACRINHAEMWGRRGRPTR